jgi:hypothetical protein
MLFMLMRMGKLIVAWKREASARADAFSLSLRLLRSLRFSVFENQRGEKNAKRKSGKSRSLSDFGFCFASLVPHFDFSDTVSARSMTRVDVTNAK